jgi:hypothetical protein
MEAFFDEKLGTHPPEAPAGKNGAPAAPLVED